MKLVPLEDRVVVKLVEQEEKTQSGITFFLIPRKRSRPKAKSSRLAPEVR